eukprot:XP_011606383.1 PREDICTED: centrosomal protein of 97 kDa [Takifugu rubripes]
MGVSDLEYDKNAGAVVDLSTRGMQKLDPNFICSDDTHTLILDGNHIMKLDHLERSPGLQQLSVASNRLVRMMGVCRLTQLKILNLPNNSIGYIEGLRDLPHLEWLNLSGNNIKVIEQLNNCVSLKHLDLSDNNISAIGDLTKLLSLKTLLLHGNSITTLRTVPAHLPAHLSILSLAENEIRDLNEVSYLASLHNIEQLSVMSNPCVMATPSLPGFDYRPYVLSWSLNLKVLDGYVVSQKEGLKAEWLYSHGKGRSYRPGQHNQLVHYLATVCPLTSSAALETAENAKLEKILSKQRLHQRQLLEETRRSCTSPPRPTQLDVKTNSSPQGGAIEDRSAQSAQKTEPVVQLNTWVGTDSSHMLLPVVSSTRLRDDHIYLEEGQAEEDKQSGSILSSDSIFLPFTSDLDPQMTHSESEDETETFEPDSLAPKWPENPAANTKKTYSLDMVENTFEGEVVPSAAVTATSPEVGDGTLKTDSETSPDVGNAGKEPPIDSEIGADKASLKEAHKAAIKIQSWWRGQHTRRCHPVAREVRSEIRLHRMQEHIVYLSGKLDKVQQQYEEERLNRLLQEEAVKFLWKQLQSMHQWRESVEQQLSRITQAVAPVPMPHAAPCEASPPAACSMEIPPSTDISYPDSGFQSTSGQHSVAGDSFLSSGTTDSLKTVRALSPVPSGFASDGAVSADCSLLEQYLSSIQQREEEEAEDAASDRTDTPQPSPPLPSNIKHSASPPQDAGDKGAEAAPTEEPAPDAEATL